MLDIRTLLIIDDCAADRKIYRRHLLRDPHQSYNILEADCAEDALTLCQENHCDAILLDFCLPDLSGLELFDKLKQEIFETAVPVIMLTGRGDQELAVQAMKRGALDYLVKQNLKPDVLQIAVRNAIKQSYLQAQLNKTQERQRLIATTALRIRQSLNLEQILNTAVAEVQQLLQCERVIVYKFASDMTGKIVASSMESSCTLALENCVGTGNWGLKTKGQTEISPNLSTLSLSNIQIPISYIYEVGLSNCVTLKEQFNTEANLVVPINISNNGNPTPKLWGLLVAQHSLGERQWQHDDVDMLYEVSIQLAIAIQQAELLAQTQAALVKEQQLNIFRSQIIGTVSHECRTPLTSILAAASTLVNHSQQLDESRQQRFLGIIEHKARYMSKLVDDMLLVNQFELDNTKFKPVPLDLLQFFSELIEQERETVDEHHELIFQVTGNTKGFWGDRGLLQQIFVNLMSNAIKYSPDGGAIKFHLIGKESQVVFSIQDQGIGIPIADQKNLFQSFSRASNVDTIPGTGLGLAISKACVDLHGGNITLYSQVGQGTKFIVSLPKRGTGKGEGRSS
ncbi:hybrid sensor histidine kinase/response regulator [Halotia branconii]|uniref:histidine kinase n=1 Tax=Halotia branconii CENA392 TaxID=1539056 RepID=A0AAJ6PBF5_9CYAN|nr:ATP-binding protein [Halotia branconii]WGV27747.1 ATP-binding protein [Halotia branconii CENA392]